MLKQQVCQLDISMSTFLSNIMKGKDYLEEVEVDGRILLNWSLKTRFRGGAFDTFYLGL